jgi:pyrroloquinoline quinone (PQQ) biosynthesis protein C
MTHFPEAIRLPHDYFLEVSPERFRLRRLIPWEQAPCNEHIAACGDEKNTRQLMAGVFYAAMSHAAVVNDTANAVAVSVRSLLHHVHRLSWAYQTTHATPSIMRAVAARMRERQRDDLAAHCLAVAEEESGHDTLALMDLAGLGLPAEQLVSDYQPASSLQLVALFQQLAQSAEPVSVLGYIYMLERVVLFTTAAHIAAIEKVLPPGVNATRCMRVHSAVGSDVGHVDQSLVVMAGLPAADRAAIARAAFTSTLLLFGATSDYPGDAAMHETLLKYGWKHGETCTDTRLTA